MLTGRRNRWARLRGELGLLVWSVEIIRGRSDQSLMADEWVGEPVRMITSASRWSPELNLSFALAIGQRDLPLARVDPSLPTPLAGLTCESLKHKTFIEHLELGSDFGLVQVVVARFDDILLLERVDDPADGERLPEVSLSSQADLFWIGVYAVLDNN